MQLPLVPYYETCDEDGPCAPYFTGHITDADGRVMCRADSEERAIELVDCVDGLSANIETLRARLAEVEAQRDGLKAVLLQGISLHEKGDAMTCMCGESVLRHNYQSDHPITPMLEYYGAQWASIARKALAKLEEK